MPSPGGEIISCEQREKKHPSEVPSVGTWMKVIKLSPVRTLRPPRSQIGSSMDGHGKANLSCTSRDEVQAHYCRNSLGTSKPYKRAKRSEFCQQDAH